MRLLGLVRLNFRSSDRRQAAALVANSPLPGNLSNRGYRAGASALICFILSIVTALWVCAAPAHAQGWPTKPIRIIVPVAPGGSTDVIARIVAARLSASLNEQFVIENRPGAGSMVGSQVVARAAPDGYTLLFAYANHTTAPFLYSGITYDPIRDFSPVSLVATQPLVVVVHPSLPVNSIKELIALARAKPGTLNYGLTAGGAGHIAAEMFKQITGTDIVAVPYKGGAPAQVALMTGEVQLLFGSAPAAMPHIKSGKVKILATTSKNRLPYLPDVPSVAEIGFKQLEIGSWVGMLAPAGTPRIVIDRLHGEIVKLLKEPETLERLAATGSDPVGAGPEEFAAHIKRELDQFGKVIKAAGIKAN